jgi:hypothetical protein
METLQLDPRTKQQIKETLYEFLYTPLLKALKSELDTLIVKNALITHSTHQSFTYRGETYSCDVYRNPRRAVALAKQLHPEMDEYLKQVSEINHKEIPYVLGFINQVLNSSNELHDYLRVLPDAIHSPISRLIATCPCRAKSLDEAEAEKLRQSNINAIALIKQRLVRNMLQ